MQFYNKFSNGVILQWGQVDGNARYSITNISLPISYQNIYIAIAGIAWSSQNNSWYTDNSKLTTMCATTDISGAIGYDNKSLSGFTIQSFSSHIWFTIGF